MGLILSAPQEKVISVIENIFGIKPDLSNKWFARHNTDRVRVIYGIDTIDFCFFEKILNNLGWLISLGRTREGIYEKYNQNKRYTKIEIARKYDKDVFFKGVLYHATYKQNMDKIMSKGLIPKCRCRRTMFDDRLFLTSSKEEGLIIKEYLSFSCRKLNRIPTENGKSVLIVLDFSDGCTFHQDPDLNIAIYTKNTISPERIIEIIE